jgi:hypothetical protein
MAPVRGGTARANFWQCCNASCGTSDPVALHTHCPDCYHKRCGACTWKYIKQPSYSASEERILLRSPRDPHNTVTWQPPRHTPTRHDRGSSSRATILTTESPSTFDVRASFPNDPLDLEKHFTTIRDDDMNGLDAHPVTPSDDLVGTQFEGTVVDFEAETSKASLSPEAIDLVQEIRLAQSSTELNWMVAAPLRSYIMTSCLKGEDRSEHSSDGCTAVRLARSNPQVPCVYTSGVRAAV